MTNSSLTRPSSLALVAVVALVLGSTGGAVAGSLVTSADIKNSTIRSKDIKNNTIRSADFAPSAAARIVGYEITDVTDEAAANEQNLVLSDTCRAGKYLLGASGYWSTSDYAPQVFIAADGRSASAYSDNTTADIDTLHLRLICANVSTGTVMRQSVRPGK